MSWMTAQRLASEFWAKSARAQALTELELMQLAMLHRIGIVVCNSGNYRWQNMQTGDWDGPFLTPEEALRAWARDVYQEYLQ